MRIRLVLDNYPAYVSNETRACPATTANCFWFAFMPVDGSWLNLVEAFLATLTNSSSCGLQVETQQASQERIERYIDRPNENPAVSKWTHKVQDILVVWRSIRDSGIAQMGPPC